LRQYTEDSSPLIRVQAAKLLDRRGDSEPLARATERLVGDLESTDHRQRLQSLALLGMVAERSTISSIVPLLHDTNSEIRNRAVLTLSRFEDPSLASTLVPLLNDPVPQVRTTAAAALRGGSR
jgi:HEAT repeat protein